MVNRISDAVSNRKVLLIADFEECPRVWKMASTLAENNYDVTLLEWNRTAKCRATKHAEKVQVYSVNLKAGYGFRVFFKSLLWGTFISFFVLLNRFAVVQPQNLDNLLPVWVICNLKKTKIVYDLADFYADSYIPSNMGGLRKVVAWLERALIKTVDATIVVDESRLKQIDLPNLPFLVIYNSPPNVYDELKGRSHNESSSHRREFTIFYAGILEKDRGLDTLVEAVQGLDGVKLVVAGFGRIEREFSEMVKGRPAVTFLGRIPHDSVLKFTFLCDCVVALYDPSFANNVFASPNKLFEAMMCGKPIIVSEGTAMADIVSRENCGLVVEHRNASMLRKAIEKLRNNQDLARSLGGSARDAYLKRYDWRFVEDKLLKLYESAIRSHVSVKKCDNSKVSGV